MISNNKSIEGDYYYLVDANRFIFMLDHDDLRKLLESTIGNRHVSKIWVRLVGSTTYNNMNGKQTVHVKFIVHIVGN